MALCKGGVWALLALLFFIELFVTLYAGFRFIFNYRPGSSAKKVKKLPATQFGIGLCYIFVCNLLAMVHVVDGSIFMLDSCKQPLRVALYVLYALQLYTLWAVLFSRIYFVFVGTVYALSKCTQRIVLTFFIMMPILLIISLVPIWPSQNNYRELNIFVAFCFLCSLAYCIWISAFFVHKLVQVLKGIDVIILDDKLLRTVTKNTILAITSISSTFIAVIIWGFASSSDANYNDVRWQYGIGFGFVVDELCSFICMMLTYQLFDHHYVLLCKCCDMQCKICCGKCVGKQLQTNTNSNAQAVRDVTADNTNTSPRPTLISMTKVVSDSEDVNGIGQ